jgi:hypothetical protein
MNTWAQPTLPQPIHDAGEMLRGLVEANAVWSAEKEFVRPVGQVGQACVPKLRQAHGAAHRPQRLESRATFLGLLRLSRLQGHADG